MWSYDKRLQFPVKIKNPNPQLAKIVISQLGGPDGELGASMRYLNQRYAMPYKECKGILTDIGTEELAHLEIVASLIYQLTDGASIEEIKAAGLDTSYAGRGTGIFLADPNGVPWNAGYVALNADPVADLTADMAAEQKARASYEHLLDLATDEDVRQVLSYLREREVVHFQRFGETLMNVQNHFEHDRYFFMNDQD